MNDEFGFNGQTQTPPSPASDQPAASGQAQYSYSQQQTYQQQPQGGYAPPMGSYVPPSAPAGHSGKGGGWIALMRTFLWILFGLICFFGIVLFSRVADENTLVGLLCLAGCVLLAFVTVAGGMIALDAAANIKRIADNSAKIFDLLNWQQYKR